MYGDFVTDSFFLLSSCISRVLYQYHNNTDKDYKIEDQNYENWSKKGPPEGSRM